MAQLLTKMKIRSQDANNEGQEMLLEIVNGPVHTILPQNSYKIGTSTKGHLVHDLDHYVNEQQIALSQNPKLKGT